MPELPLLVVDVQRGGPVHRPAHQDRAGRPAAGDVRPQRRGPGAGHRAALAGRLLRRRARGRPDRGHLPHAGDPAVRRLPRQRLRAVAGPRRRRRSRRSTRRSPPSPTRRRRRASRVLALPARRRDARPAVGRARHGRAGAPHRRPREGRRARRHLLRPRQPRPDDPRCARRRSTASPVPDVEVDDPTGDAKLLVLGWGSTYGPIGAGAPPRARAGPQGRRRPTCGTSTRSPPTSARCCARYDTGARPRDEPRPARRCCCAASYLVDAKSYTKVPGLPFKAEELQDLFLDYLSGVHA